MNDKLNPELVKAGAEMANPDAPWEISGNTVPSIFAADSVGRVILWFNPLKNDSDFKALMLALMKKENGNWEFGQYEDGTIFYGNGGYPCHVLTQESFPLLLLSCVSAMKEIEVYI